MRFRPSIFIGFVFGQFLLYIVHDKLQRMKILPILSCSQAKIGTWLELYLKPQAKTV